MKIVIDIPDVVKQRLDEGHIENGSIMSWALLDMIKNGTVLPKGHGDLIDRDKLEKDTEWSEYEDEFISYSYSQIFSEPVVIPADK